MQAEQFHGHRHSVSYLVSNHTLPSQKDNLSEAHFMADPVRVGSSTDYAGGNETHPPNAYVMYFIYLGRHAIQTDQSEEQKRKGQIGSIRRMN